MKKFSFFLLILLLTRVGTSYAAPNDGTTLDFQNFFLGDSANPNVNVNQVLDQQVLQVAMVLLE